MDPNNKKILISATVIISYLLYKFGLSEYTYTKSEYDNLNKKNLVEPPLRGNLKLTSPFGYRSFKGIEFHNGIDLVFKKKNVNGDPIYAPLNGTISANYFNDRGGFQLVLDSGYAKFGFAHLYKRSAFNIGSKIKKGQIIGYVGNTGTSTGSHLHFTLRLNNILVDPILNIRSLKNAIS